MSFLLGRDDAARRPVAYCTWISKNIFAQLTPRGTNVALVGKGSKLWTFVNTSLGNNDQCVTRLNSSGLDPF